MVGDEAGEEGTDQITCSPLCLVAQLCLTLCDPLEEEIATHPKVLA